MGIGTRRNAPICRVVCARKETRTTAPLPPTTDRGSGGSSIEEPSMTSMDQRHSSRPPSTATHRHTTIGRPIRCLTAAPRRAVAPTRQRVHRTPGNGASRANVLRQNRFLVRFAVIAHLHFPPSAAGRRARNGQHQAADNTHAATCAATIPISSGGLVVIMVTRSSPPKLVVPICDCSMRIHRPMLRGAAVGPLPIASVWQICLPFE
jgi:hypothetical protein